MPQSTENHLNLSSLCLSFHLLGLCTLMLPIHKVISQTVSASIMVFYYSNLLSKKCLRHCLDTTKLFNLGKRCKLCSEAISLLSSTLKDPPHY